MFVLLIKCLRHIHNIKGEWFGYTVFVSCSVLFAKAQAIFFFFFCSVSLWKAQKAPLSISNPHTADPFFFSLCKPFNFLNHLPCGRRLSQYVLGEEHGAQWKRLQCLQSSPFLLLYIKLPESATVFTSSEKKLLDRLLCDGDLLCFFFYHSLAKRLLICCSLLCKCVPAFRCDLNTSCCLTIWSIMHKCLSYLHSQSICMFVSLSTDYRDSLNCMKFCDALHTRATQSSTLVNYGDKRDF